MMKSDATNKKSLFAIQEQYLDLFAQLEEAAQSENMLEALQDLDSALAIDAAEFEEKAEAYAFRIRQLKNEAEFLKSESKALADKARRAETAAQRLHDRISEALAFRGVKKINTGHYTLSFRKSQAVDIIEPDAVPDCYIRSEIVSKIDKAGIKQALKVGEKVAGAALVERQSLQIK